MTPTVRLETVTVEIRFCCDGSRWG
ncbi:hypothetical protein A2U01_0028371, partial [Trifolium medium]|nr:hypothetical protein [Trifolium medium]